MHRRLWFMGRPMSIRQGLVRVWRTGACTFSDVLVNEHPLVSGRLAEVRGDLEHHDSPNLHHWWEKQNRYSTAEALTVFRKLPLVAEPKLFGTKLQRRMWLKTNYRLVPFRYSMLFLYALIVQGAWISGWRGFAWARLRAEVYRMIDLKFAEMQIGVEYEGEAVVAGVPDPRVEQCDWEWWQSLGVIVCGFMKITSRARSWSVWSLKRVIME